jgi:zinc protease
LKQMQTESVPEDTLNRAKAFLLQQIPLSESSVHSIADGLISLAANELPLTEPFDAAREYLRLTPQQVQAAFAKWIRPADFVQVTEGPKTD